MLFYAKSRLLEYHAALDCARPAVPLMAEECCAWLIQSLGQTDDDHNKYVVTKVVSIHLSSTLPAYDAIMSKDQHRLQVQNPTEDPPPPPPQYASEAVAEAVLGAPPPYSQQGPPLPARRDSQPHTPPRKESSPSIATPPASEVGRQHSSVAHGTLPSVASGSGASAAYASPRPDVVNGISRLSLKQRQSDPSLPKNDKPLPPVPQPTPPVPPPSSRHARPVSYAGAPTYNPAFQQHSRTSSAQVSSYATPPVPPRPSGPPSFSPPAIAVHSGLVRGGPQVPADAHRQTQPPHRAPAAPTVGDPNGFVRRPNPFAGQPPLPRHNQPKPKTQSEPGGRRRPYPAIAAFPGPPPPRHPVARSAVESSTVTTPPPRHPVASSSSSVGKSCSKLSSPAAAASPSPSKQKEKKVTIPISAPLYAAVTKKESKSVDETPRGSGVIDLTGLEDSPPRLRAGPSTPIPRSASRNLPLSPSPNASGSSSPAVVRCAGFTRAGTPCKRQVKATAPYLLQRDMNADDDDAPRAIGRYCRDHAGLVCAADGFYWRNTKGLSGTYVKFKDYIPSDLGEQTRTLLRLTMEAPLSSKDAPGHLYAYELRSLSNPRTAYIKVGRTDNVPRRLGQWTSQCTSHTPTLRDVFPLKSLGRQPSRLGSLLPGATKSTDLSKMAPFVKRWERLVHLELADRAASARGKEYQALLGKCTDCDTVHKEIFPLPGPKAYETVVAAIERWEKFVRVIAATMTM